MANSSTEFQKDMESLKEDLAQLRSDMSNIAHTIKDISSDRAGSARDHAREELDRRLEQLTQTYETFRKKGKQSAASVHHTLEKRPVTSVAIAFGAGLVLGKILAGK